MARARRYSKEWPALSKQVCEEAGWKCEKCGVPHGTVRRSRNGKHYKVRLNGCHLDQNSLNDERSNIKAMCQACHLKYDDYWNRTKAAETALLEQELETAKVKEAEEIYKYIAELPGKEPEQLSMDGIRERPKSLKDRLARSAVTDGNDKGICEL